MPRGKPVDETQARTIARKQAVTVGAKFDFFKNADGPQIFTGSTVPVSGFLFSADLRGLSGTGSVSIPDDAIGVIINVTAAIQSAQKYVFFDPSGAPEALASAAGKFLTQTVVSAAGPFWVPLGPDGKIQASISAGSTVTNLDAWVVGWWT